MDKLIYTTLSGANGVMQRQDTLTQNLANVNTPGYRQIAAQARALAVEPAGSLGTRVFAVETTPGASFAPGAVTATGRPLDVALQGDGWLTVQGRDGREAYTRNGALALDPRGQLIGAQGLPLLGETGPLVVPPGAEVSIANDGTVAATVAGAAGPESQVVGRLKLVNPPTAQLQRGDDGLFRTPTPAPVDRKVGLMHGAIEGSNVNSVDALVGMINAARAFDLHMKMLQTAEANSRSAGTLLQPSAG